MARPTKKAPAKPVPREFSLQKKSPLIFFFSLHQIFVCEQEFPDYLFIAVILVQNLFTAGNMVQNLFTDENLVQQMKQNVLRPQSKPPAKQAVMFVHCI